MKSTFSLVRTLRVAALFILVAGLGSWAANGARVGWTQTSVVTIQRDEITGIDFPVRSAAFVPGIEVPLLAAAIAAAAAGVSVLAQRRSRPINA